MQQPQLDRLIREELLTTVVARDIAIMGDWEAPSYKGKVKAAFELLQKCVHRHVSDDTQLDAVFHPYVFKLAGKILEQPQTYSEENISKAIEKAFKLSDEVMPKTFKFDSSLLGGIDTLA